MTVCRFGVALRAAAGVEVVSEYSTLTRKRENFIGALQKYPWLIVCMHAENQTPCASAGSASCAGERILDSALEVKSFVLATNLTVKV